MPLLCTDLQLAHTNVCANNKTYVARTNVCANNKAYVARTNVGTNSTANGSPYVKAHGATYRATY